jgi:hypothetical protein
MRFPIRPLTGRWPPRLERRFARFCWADPRVIMDPDATGEDFTRAMSAIHVGGTIKITGGNRHPVADQMLTDNVDLSDATIVDIGASDGSTSVDLISKLPTFKQYVIADLYFHVTAVHSGRRCLFYDTNGSLILVAGPRALAWPSTSRMVRLLYRGCEIRARASKATGTPVLLLNPAARTVIDADPRVSYRVHDVFTPWSGPRPTVIKVANLLRRLYFTDDVITSGLQAIGESLDEQGYFLLVDNVRRKGVPPRVGLYQRLGGRFRVVSETPDRPEIADLIDQVRLTPTPGAAATPTSDPAGAGAR